MGRNANEYFSLDLNTRQLAKRLAKSPYIQSGFADKDYAVALHPTGELMMSGGGLDNEDCNKWLYRIDCSSNNINFY